MSASILRSKNTLIEMKSAELVSAHDENRELKRRRAVLESTLENTQAELIRVRFTFCFCVVLYGTVLRCL